MTIFVILPFVAKSQSILAKRYVDDRINESTHLYFRDDGTFEFKYLYDLIGDQALGHYKQHNDTLFLTYSKDTLSNIQFIENAISVRADSLIIKGNKLYRIKNGKSKEFEPQDVTYQKPPKNSHYTRKYLFFGSWHSNWSKYYMIDERNAKWATKKWLEENKDLFK